jgi:hypothetical protein
MLKRTLMFSFEGKFEIQFSQNEKQTKSCDQQENRTPNLQIWNLTRYQLRQPAGENKKKNTP